MKKRRIEKFTAVILALLLLVSCAPKSTNGANSTLGENETHNNVIANQQTNTETNEKTEIKENETASENKSEVQKPISSKPSQKEETTSRLPVERPDGTKQEVSTSSEESSSSADTSSGAVKLPYYMPGDNPPPISIHRADAATPTPFSYTGSLGGEEIDFKLDTSTVTYSWDLYKTVSVIKTYDELKHIQSYDNELRYIQWREKYDKYGAPYDFLPSDLYTSRYDEEFFKDRALIELFEDGGHECDISKVLKNGDQLCIYHKAKNVSKSAYASQQRIFIEVSKEDLATVKTLAIYYKKIF